MYRRSLRTDRAAALSATALMPTDASARAGSIITISRLPRPLGSAHRDRRRLLRGCYVKRLVETPYGLRYRTVNVCF